ncbi:GFA family protein [Rhodoligotrophos appendicifer]|uniref:GFA family protein n=1 Tax=Rhodoligotrophos appendicifer TaxID=987056 RepID=UPI0011872A93|nr:GFA family protein [Rhodoligotrophos appendicifer]
MVSKREGSCLCGAVQFTAGEPLRPIVYCHCRQCRKQTGHFLASTATALDRFQLTCDQGLAWYRASEIATRGFCRICGSTLFWQRDGADEISIAAGTLDDSTGLIEDGHIFCAEKGGYYEPAGGKYQVPGSDRPATPQPEVLALRKPSMSPYPVKRRS